MTGLAPYDGAGRGEGSDGSQVRKFASNLFPTADGWKAEATAKGWS